MNYKTALNYREQIASKGLLAVMKEIGLDVFESDRINADIRERHGDTPYCAPDVIPEEGRCGGGDAWPLCCTGHSFESDIETTIYDHEARLEEEEEERIRANTPEYGTPEAEWYLMDDMERQTSNPFSIFDW